ncbi:hypothetical protein BC826DRAFT_1007568 [Russula brevipes]|nr:hypothetical protein BC826DRAFT_1007568 [Russula brevipes]
MALFLSFTASFSALITVVSVQGGISQVLNGFLPVSILLSPFNVSWWLVGTVSPNHIRSS